METNFLQLHSLEIGLVRILNIPEHDLFENGHDDLFQAVEVLNITSRELEVMIDSSYWSVSGRIWATRKRNNVSEKWPEGIDR